MLRRPLVAAAVLLAIYLALSFVNDPRGYLGTDTGGKVATLQAMEQRGRLDPDVGYWAERWDPAGTLHPLFYTSKLDGKWVNVTTLPALYAAYPLWRLAGYRGALLVPMLGSVFAALAAAALVRRMGRDDATASVAFWVVGLASPLTIYALDFWEHSLGVALIAWATVFLVDVAQARSSPVVRSFAAGLLFGVAATMRTEALVYGAVVTATAGGVLLLRSRRVAIPIAVGAAALVGLGVPLLANSALERATIGTGLRAERATNNATSAVSGRPDTSVPSRTDEAMTTAFSLEPSLDTAPQLVGVVATALLAFAATRAGLTGDVGPAVLAFAGAAVIYALRFAGGAGFVPGMFAAAPFAVVGAAGAWRNATGRVIAFAALAALLVVWRFQYRGGAVPQWGGRYILSTGLLLAAVGLARVPEIRRGVVVAFVALAACVTGFGLTWLAIRSHDVGRTSSALDRRPEPVLVSRLAHLAREGGWFYGNHRWLTAINRQQEMTAARVVRQAGFAEFGLVGLRENRDATPPTFPGFRYTGRSRIRFFSGIDLEVMTYRAR